MKITDLFVAKSNSLDVEIEAVLSKLRKEDPCSDNYDILMNNLERLYELRNLDSKGKITPDAKALILSNILGIVVILSYERFNVITTKALGFVPRLRV